MVNKKSDITRQSKTRKVKRRKKIPFGLLFLSFLTIVILSILTAGNELGPEKWWWSSFNLYLPQWVWSLPGLCLFILAVFKHRNWSWLPLICILWVVGPIMGLRWHWNRKPDGKHIRVLTYNIKNGARDQGAIANELRETQPDIVLFQEMSHHVKKTVDPILNGWNVRTMDQFLVASRYPINNMTICERAIGGVPQHGVRCQLEIGDKTITVYAVHFISPRSGLGSLRHKREDGISEWESNVAGRLAQSQQLLEEVRMDKGPVIIGGDFNSPVLGLTCRNLFNLHMTDAFDAAGRGYGYTYGKFLKPQYSFIRIDHILYNKYWQAENCWAGNDEGSDHRPVIADLYLH